MPYCTSTIANPLPAIIANLWSKDGKKSGGHTNGHGDINGVVVIYSNIDTCLIVNIREEWSV